MAERMARAEAPQSMDDVIRLGRLTALRTPREGVRGTVAGDIPHVPTVEQIRLATMR